MKSFYESSMKDSDSVWPKSQNLNIMYSKSCDTWTEFSLTFSVFPSAKDASRLSACLWNEEQVNPADCPLSCSHVQVQEGDGLHCGSPQGRGFWCSVSRSPSHQEENRWEKGQDVLLTLWGHIMILKEIKCSLVNLKLDICHSLYLIKFNLESK